MAMSRPITGTLVVLILTAGGLGLAACGKSADTASTPIETAGQDGGGAAPSAATVRCPARVRTPARPAQAPVDDIAGVRPGLTYDEAANLVLCEDKGLVVKATTRGFNLETPGQRLRQGFEALPAQPVLTGQEIVKKMQDDAMARSSNRLVEALKPGEQLFHVSTMGPPDQDRVIGVWREQWFAEGREPSKASVVEALVKKYGPPSVQEPERVLWLYDSLGRPIGRDSPTLNECQSRVGSTPRSISLSPDCGLSIAARIVPLRTNPDLARSLEVGVADQAKAYAAIEATERTMADMDAARRAAEVDRANQNAEAPKL